MTLQTIAAIEAIDRLDGYTAIVDARSESEYALDRIPGALNWPTLDDAERAAIGTEYAQVSPFQARKRGAALAARNIASHIERHVIDLGRDWQPLVYCWRGGQRSGALSTVLSQIGFRVHQLEGGYQAFRRAVVERLDAVVASLRFVVVSGTTGSGKSLVLRTLAAAGEPVLDLEALARHRGSVLGLVPGEAQPTQKAFETGIWDALRRCDGSRPVWVESESAKVGDLRVPPRLLARIRESPCVRLDVSIEARVRLLAREYGHFLRDVDAFCERLGALRALRGREVVERWQQVARAGRSLDVVRELLESHYDPIYLQSMKRNFIGFEAPLARVEWGGDDAEAPNVAQSVAAAVRP